MTYIALNLVNLWTSSNGNRMWLKLCHIQGKRCGKTRAGKLPKCPQFRETVVTVSWIVVDCWYQHVVDTPGSLVELRRHVCSKTCLSLSVFHFLSDFQLWICDKKSKEPTNPNHATALSPKLTYAFFSKKTRSFGWMPQAEHLIAGAQQHLGFETR